jgi:hypothetical protein
VLFLPDINFGLFHRSSPLPCGETFPAGIFQQRPMRVKSVKIDYRKLKQKKCQLQQPEMSLVIRSRMHRRAPVAAGGMKEAGIGGKSADFSGRSPPGQRGRRRQKTAGSGGKCHSVSSRRRKKGGLTLSAYADTFWP